MTDKNPWHNDSNKDAGNSGESSQQPNPWESKPAAENPWAVYPETTSFPPVDENRQVGPARPWDESADFATDSYYDDAHYGFNDQAGYEQESVPPQDPPKRKRRWVLPVVITFALIALVAGAVVIAIQTGWLNLNTGGDEEPVMETEIVVVPAEEDSSDTNEDGANDEESNGADGDEEESDEVEAKDEEADEESEESRPSAIPLPRSASEVSSSDSSRSARSVAPEEREFDSVFTGSSVTSEAFARQVYSAYLDFYEDTGETSGAITAYSPVTQLNYDMDCKDNGSFVTCTGGNNAVVYIS